MPAAEMRAALRVFFALSYAATLLMYTVLGIGWREVLVASAWMLPCLIVGGGLGLFARGRVSDAQLRGAFLVLLLSMSIALIIDALR